LCEDNYPANYKGCTSQRPRKKTFPYFTTEEGNNNQTTTTGQTYKHTVGNCPTRQNLCLSYKKAIDCESNLPGYSGTGNASKPRSVHRRSHAKIPENIERIYGQNMPTNVWPGTVVIENMQWKKNSN